MNVIGEPIDERGPINTKIKLPIHREAPLFVDQAGSEDVLITGIKVIFTPLFIDHFFFCKTQKILFIRS